MDSSILSASKTKEGITARSTRAEHSKEKGKYVVGRCLSLVAAGGATVHQRQLPRSAMQARITKAASTMVSSGTPITIASSSNQLMELGSRGKDDGAGTAAKAARADKAGTAVRGAKPGALSLEGKAPA